MEEEANLTAEGDTRPNMNEDGTRPPRGYEYLDHTADIQLHSWGLSLSEAFEQTAVAMFGYMTDLDSIEEQRTLEVEVSGHDLQSLMYNFLDEWLYQFSAETYFIPFKVNVTEWTKSEEDGEIKVKALGLGETFDLQKHPQGTEVKAITYSAMETIEKEDSVDAFVIVDI